jgi:serralysin
VEAFGTPFDDTLIGGAGNDTLTGGTGFDSVLFASALNGSTNVDRISGFVVADDTIRLENAVFTQLTTTCTRAASAFVRDSAAADAGDRIVQNSVTGQISYDPDGTGGAARMLFGVVGAGTALTAADFVIV